jgi:thymidylate synthase (FAD)
MIKVLDKGFVRLVSFTQPYLADQGDGWSGDLEIVRNARVSYDADWRREGTIVHESFCPSQMPPMSNGEKRPCVCEPKEANDSKLISYLYRNQHSTPFEAISFTFEVKAPIFVLRQWHRHRTWTYNEVSARYTELPSDFYVPNPEDIGSQDPKNKQGRVGVGKFHPADERMRQQSMVDGFWTEASMAHKTYQDRLIENVPRELARINLPLSTYSRMFATVNLWNLFRFLQLRDHSHAQWEIRQYAKALKELVRPIVPAAVDAFDRYQMICVDTQATTTSPGSSMEKDPSSSLNPK